MQKLQETYYGYLTKKEGFYMDQYKSIFHNEDRWISIKNFEEGLYAVVILNEENEDVDIEEIENYLNQKGKQYSLQVIIISDGNYIKGYSNNVSRLVINKKDLSTIYCDEACDVLKKIFYNMATVANKKKIPFYKKYKITTCLIVINILVYIVEVILAKNLIDIDVKTLIELGGKYGPLIDAGEVWRLVTCTFLHGGITHILFNMYALYAIGPQIEEVYGRVKYLIIYITSGITASLLGYLIDPFTVSIGASGAIFGLLGALLVYAVKERGRLQKGVITNLLVVVGINLGIGLTLPNIDNLGHIGGFLGGILLSVVLIITKNEK